VSNVARPEAVFLDDQPVAERREVEQGAEPGWRYDSAHAFLAIRIPHDGETSVRIEGVTFRAVERLPQPKDRIEFTFDEGAEGWAAAHDIDPLVAEGGVLRGTVTGGDPYVVRHCLKAKAADCPILVIRLRLTAGGGGQLFWTTDASPAFDEEKSVHFPVQPDGQFHDVALQVGEHPLWKGTITALRVDPTSGVNAAEFALDSVRGEKK
jgi:hypothetical protein